MTGTAALALTMLGLSLLLALTQEAAVSHILVAIYINLAVAPLWMGHGRRLGSTHDRAEPIIGLSLLYLTYFGLRSLYVLHAEWDPRLEFLPSIDRALLYAIAGLLALQLGYRSRIGVRLATKLPQMRSAVGSILVSPRTFFALWSLVLFCRAYLMLSGFTYRFVSYDMDIGGLLNAVSYFSSSLARVIFALGAVTALSPGGHNSKWFTYSFWLVVFPLELAWAAVGGEKKLVAYDLAIVLLAYHYLKRPLRLRWMVATATAGLLLIFPLVNSYRNAVHAEAAGTRSQSVPLSGVLEDSQDGIIAAAQTATAEIIWRFPGIDSLTVQVQEAPTLADVHLGATILPKLVALVPAVLLPNKNELIGVGSLFNRNIFGEWVYSDLPITSLGELYYNFHVVGVAVGMFSFGVLYRITYTYFITIGDRAALFLYLPLLMLVLNIESDIGILASEAIRQLVFGVIVALWIGAAGRARPAALRLSVDGFRETASS